MLDLLTKTFSLGRALLTGVDVSEERLKKRLEICSTCPKVKKDNQGCMFCSLCGCKVKGDKSLINMARYEETSSYGCKISGGSKWKAQGV